MKPENIRDARKEKINEDKAWELILKKEKIYIGKGKKVLEFEPDEADKEMILKSAMGRSGNLRAPAVNTENAMVIGYNDTIYNNL